MPPLRLHVIESAAETPLIRRIVLARADGGALPGFDAGAHIAVHVPGVGLRKYSLINAAPRTDATAAPSAYVLGVRREDSGQGGSQWMHRLTPGDIVEADPPANDFPLSGGAGRVTLVAGGIGVTPLIGMAARLKTEDRPFRFFYAARARGEFAFLAALRDLVGDALVLHTDDDADGLLDIGAILRSCQPEEPLHVCGPSPMIAAASDTARALGWAEGRLRYELFFSPSAEPQEATPVAPATAFEVELRQSGRIITVPQDRTILDVLIDAGVDPLHDCDKGECGVCQVPVLEGVPDHRDHILTEAERAAGKLIQICVSRAKTPMLVLDL